MASSPTFRTAEVLPRLIRLRDAPAYLGMDRNRFNQTVRPCLIEIPIGDQGIAFDRLDLDAWAEDYKSRNGRPGCKFQPEEENSWAKKSHLASANAAASGTLKKRSTVVDYTKVLEQAISSKPSGS